MARIIAGEGKGRRLKAPKGLATRPTGARVRQTLFDILAPRLPGCRFLDAFAGSGAVGLEALSRGAAVVVLVETDAAAVAAVRQRDRAGQGLGRVRVVRRAPGSRWRRSPGRERFDVLYLTRRERLYEAALGGRAGTASSPGRRRGHGALPGPSENRALARAGSAWGIPSQLLWREQESARPQP
jgi:hypothetical protein